MIFDGTQPTLTHVPPKVPRSIMVTLAPASAAFSAAAKAPPPLPITTMCKRPDGFSGAHEPHASVIDVAKCCSFNCDCNAGKLISVVNYRVKARNGRENARGDKGR